MKVIILGATGLVGQSILKQCLERNDVTEILVFGRRKTHLTDPRVRESVVDFDNIENWKHLVTGDILFSALGTTLKVAGTKEAQFKIDYTYQFEFARIAAANKVGSYLLISSVNADAKSSFFYLKMKGQLEEAVSKLSFPSIIFLRPGPLTGKREVPRLNEIISTKILDLFPASLVAPSIRPVPAQRVAKVAIDVAFRIERGIKIIDAKTILNP